MKQSIFSIPLSVLIAGFATIVVFAAWITYWFKVIEPSILETAYESCMENVPNATGEKCKCVSRKMADQLGKYVYLDRILKGTWTPEEMRAIKNDCGIAS